MKRISLKNLSEQSGYSRSTLFRVLRNAPGVRASTRESVIRLLNLHGYVVEHHSGPEKIVIDTPIPNLYPEHLASLIGERLELEQYHVVQTRSWKRKALFLREIADADAVIFTSSADRELLRLTRESNPEIYRISLFSRCPEESELTIGVDNFGGAILAANIHRQQLHPGKISAGPLRTDLLHHSSGSPQIPSEARIGIRCVFLSEWRSVGDSGSRAEKRETEDLLASLQQSGIYSGFAGSAPETGAGRLYQF